MRIVKDSAIREHV